MGAILKKDIYADPSEDRILPYNGQAFFTLNRINNGHMTQKAYKLDQLEFVLSNIANDRDTYMAQSPIRKFFNPDNALLSVV